MDCEYQKFIKAVDVLQTLEFATKQSAEKQAPNPHDSFSEALSHQTLEARSSFQNINNFERVPMFIFSA